MYLTYALNSFTNQSTANYTYPLKKKLINLSKIHYCISSGHMVPDLEALWTTNFRGIQKFQSTMLPSINVIKDFKEILNTSTNYVFLNRLKKFHKEKYLNCNRDYWPNHETKIQVTKLAEITIIVFFKNIFDFIWRFSKSLFWFYRVFQSKSWRNRCALILLFLLQ